MKKRLLELLLGEAHVKDANLVYIRGRRSQDQEQLMSPAQRDMKRAAELKKVIAKNEKLRIAALDAKDN
jgi:hypothetical protein